MISRTALCMRETHRPKRLRINYLDVQIRHASRAGDSSDEHGYPAALALLHAEKVAFDVLRL